MSPVCNLIGSFSAFRCGTKGGLLMPLNIERIELLLIVAAFVAMLARRFLCPIRSAWCWRAGFWPRFRI